jgi:transcription elongation factor Elf1
MARDPKLEKAFARLAELYEYGELLASTDPSAFIDQVVRELRARRSEIDGEPGPYRRGHEFFECPSCAAHILVEHVPRRDDVDATVDISCTSCGAEFSATLHPRDGTSAPLRWYSYDCDESFVEHTNEDDAIGHIDEFVSECRGDYHRDGSWPDGVSDQEIRPHWGYLVRVGQVVQVRSGASTEEYALARDDGTEPRAVNVKSRVLED